MRTYERNRKKVRMSKHEMLSAVKKVLDSQNEAEKWGRSPHATPTLTLYAKNINDDIQMLEKWITNI